MQKRIRVVDEELLETVRNLPCLHCGVTPVDPHHVTSVKAGGDDVATNILPVCRAAHILWHQKGPGYMIDNFPAIRYWLELAGRQDVLDRARR